MSGLDFAPTGGLLATSNQAGNVTFWNPATGEVSRVSPGCPQREYPRDHFSPDGRVLATASERIGQAMGGRGADQCRPASWPIERFVESSSPRRTRALGRTSGLFGVGL